MATETPIGDFPAGTVAGGELLAAQSPGGDAVSITPEAIAQYLAENPYYYGVAANRAAVAGRTAEPGTNVLEFPQNQKDNVPGAWETVTYTFTVPAGKGGLWTINAGWGGDNFAISGNPQFVLALMVTRNGAVVAGDEARMREDDYADIPYMVLQMCDQIWGDPGDVFQVVLINTDNDPLTYDGIGSYVRYQFEG